MTEVGVRGAKVMSMRPIEVGREEHILGESLEFWTNGNL